MKHHSRQAPYFHHVRPPAERPRWLVVVWARSCACRRCARIGGGVLVRYIWRKRIRSDGEYRRAAIRAARVAEEQYWRERAPWRRVQVQLWLEDGTRVVWREHGSLTPLHFAPGELFGET